MLLSPEIGLGRSHPDKGELRFTGDDHGLISVPLGYSQPKGGQRGLVETQRPGEVTNHKAKVVEHGSPLLSRDLIFISCPYLPDKSTRRTQPCHRSVHATFLTLWRGDVSTTGYDTPLGSSKDHVAPILALCYDRSRCGPDLRFSSTEMSKVRSEEHTSELQSRQYLVCRLLLEKKNTLSTSTTS